MATCHRLPRPCAAAPLLLGDRRLSLLIDISCPRRAQQQTRRTLLLWSIDGTDRQTDGRTPDRYTDLAPRTIRTVSIKQQCIAGSAPVTPCTMDSSNLGARRRPGHDSDVNKVTCAKATATCCRSTARARQRTADESAFRKFSSTPLKTFSFATNAFHVLN